MSIENKHIYSGSNEKPVDTINENSVSNALDVLEPAVEAAIKRIEELRKTEADLLKSIDELEKRKNTLYEEAMTDALTGLPNRRALDRLLEHTFESGRSREGDAKKSFLGIDIDHFKKINDTHGHDMGDEALCLVAQTIKDSLREGENTAFRNGGEEFAAIVDASGADAVAIAERIRANIEALDHSFLEGRTNPITVSIGVADFASVDDPKTLLKHADLALYKSKSGGRNRVTVYTEGQEIQEDMNQAA